MNRAFYRRAWPSQQPVTFNKPAPLEDSERRFIFRPNVLPGQHRVLGELSSEWRFRGCPYLDEGDAVGWHGDVIAQLVEELRRNPQGGAAKLKLVGPETKTHLCERHSRGGILIPLQHLVVADCCHYSPLTGCSHTFYCSFNMERWRGQIYLKLIRIKGLHDSKGPKHKSVGTKEDYWDRKDEKTF